MAEMLKTSDPTPPQPIHIPFETTYSGLPKRFYAHCPPAPFPRPEMVRFNAPLADALRIERAEADNAALAAAFSGQRPPEGAAWLAMAYAGHQFGHLVPALGDGRAVLMGEVIDRSGQRRDIQLKGAGLTPFSRHADGRAPLGPVLREYVVSEAMYALGVPTSRALAAVTTGEPVLRETAQPGAVLTRVASSHLRVGTFEYFAVRDDQAAVQQLADYAITRHDPDARDADNPYLELLRRVSRRQAELIADWMALGFIHGVMNTDNTTLSGETIDYGPCAFMDHYHPGTVYSFVDQMGRYAYGNQPGIGQWNLARFAEALLRLLGNDSNEAIAAAREILEAYTEHHEAAWLERMRAKLGLATAMEEDRALVDHLLAILARNRVDFTGFFRRLADAAETTTVDSDIGALFQDPDDWQRWSGRWRERLDLESADSGTRAAAMRWTNPAVIPRTHAIEQAIRAAEDEGDFAPFHALVEAVSHPFEAPESTEAPWARPPRPEERVPNTFCGT